jgi:hypothetical protein
MFLNFLGIGKDKLGTLKPFQFEPDDVSAEDLGGRLIDLPTLPPDERYLFRGFLRMADKAAAHFTRPIEHDWTKSHEVIIRIYERLRAHVYQPTGRSLPVSL